MGTPGAAGAAPQDALWPTAGVLAMKAAAVCRLEHRRAHQCCRCCTTGGCQAYHMLLGHLGCLWSLSVLPLVPNVEWVSSAEAVMLGSRQLQAQWGLGDQLWHCKGVLRSGTGLRSSNAADVCRATDCYCHCTMSIACICKMVAATTGSDHL